MSDFVSAIMVTRGRPKWAMQSLGCYLDQTYPDRELVILDDADDPSFPDFAAPEPVMRSWLYEKHVSYFRIPQRMTIPNKRNHAVIQAQYDILWHLDSDDWSAPNRMAEQVKLLKESNLAVTGYHSMIFHAGSRGVWKFKGDNGYPMGTSLCYRRTFWQNHPFIRGSNAVDDNIGEDNEFAKAARQAEAVVSLDAGLMMVARIHPDNSSKKEPERGELVCWDRYTGGLPEGFRA